MKHILYIILLLFFTNCSNSDNSTEIIEDSIFGKWELYSLPDGSYDDIDGYKNGLPKYEFIAPNIIKLTEQPYEGEGGIYVLTGTFDLNGDILSLNYTAKNGTSFVDSNVFIDVKISSSRLEWGINYNDGYDSGYQKYLLRKLN